MSNTNDDPREVLAILNSLGFIGITAPQLKAFMKDLKIYKKIKERERQQYKEEIRKRILKKQQQMVEEILSEHSKQLSGRTNDNSNSSNFDNDSLVKVRIRCISKDNENLQQKCIKTKYDEPLKEDPKLLKIKHKKSDLTEQLQLDRKSCHMDTKSCSNVQQSRNNNHCTATTCSMQNVFNTNYDINKYSTISQNLSNSQNAKPIMLDQNRPRSAPNMLASNHKSRSKCVSSESSIGVRSQSLPRTKNSSCSTQKSFIRPWRLHPDVQKSVVNKRCDPVALYQKYQEEWKQISLPGETKHMGVRWAIREKMLGSDPHPPPLPTKSISAPTLRKK